MAKSALKLEALGAELSLLRDPSSAEPALLANLCATLAQSAQVYQAAARRIGPPLMRTLFLQRSAARLEFLRSFQRRHLALTGGPTVVLAATVAPAELLGSDEASVVDGLERHDRGVWRILAEAEAAGVLSRASKVLVRSVIETITADHRQVRDLNLILH